MTNEPAKPLSETASLDILQGLAIGVQTALVILIEHIEHGKPVSADSMIEFFTGAVRFGQEHNRGTLRDAAEIAFGEGLVCRLKQRKLAQAIPESGARN